MRALLAALVLLPCVAYAAPEAYPVALIDRPLVLPQGKAEFGLLGNLSNWAVSNDSITGEAGVLDAEIGLGKAQIGLALHAGYEGLFNLGNGGGTEHFLPIGIDAVVSTPGGADIGASFSLAGALGNTNSIAGTVPGYADIRMATLWLRLRT